MPPVTLPPVLTANPLAAAPVLQPGTVMQAVVAQLLDELTLRLQLPGGAALDVKTDQPLPAGTRVQVAVAGTAAQPRIVLTPLPALPSPAAAPLPSQTAPLNPVGATHIEAGKPLPASTPLVLPETAAAPKQALQAAVTAMLRDAVGKQNGLAPLMADVEVALSRADLPQPVRAAAAQLLALRVDTNAPVTAPDIKAALLRSGIVGEAVALQPAQPASIDLKAALTTLKDALANWVAKDNAASVPDIASSKPPAPAAAPLPLAPRTNLPPPHRLAPTIAQPPLPASLPEEAGAREAALHLLNKTEGALARQALLQIASLPDESGAGRAEQSVPRLTLDIPLATPQGTAVAQLRVEREASRRGGPDIRPLWRANFSIDLEPIGPVHASIALFGERAAVTLYAERDESAERLREGLPVLEASLKDAAFETGELRCRAGAPSTPQSAPGLFVDQAS